MLELERRGGVAVLRIVHGKANALDTELCVGIADRLDALEAGPGSAAVVLTGTGSIFSAGVDLFRVLEGGADYLAAFLPAFGRMLERLFGFPGPVLAAVNGHAVAGGFVLACACDRRLMVEEGGTVGLPELRVGIPFPRAALEIVRFATPAECLEELLYGGRTYTPREALDRGLVHGLVPSEALLDRACAEAEERARIPDTVFALTKRQVRAPVLERLGPGPWRPDPDVRALWEDPASQDAIRAYLERTLGKGRRDG